MDLARKPIALMLLCLVAAVPVSAADAPKERGASTTTYHRQKVVYHISDAEIAGMALRNAQNHINAVGNDQLELVVVTYGKGIDFLLDGWKDSSGKSYDTQVQDLASQGVKFDVCNNTLTARKINPDLVNMNAEVVPSGVATIAELQMQGYVYLKP